MAIESQDIKLMASERLTDNEDGGGRMSAIEVVDGVVNNAFPDISRLDRAYGRVNLRKVYASVETDDTAVFYGSHAIITDTPLDPKVSVLMFSTKSFTDERDAAKNHIENYLGLSIRTNYVLFGNQLAGQRTIVVYSDVQAKKPQTGDVFVLRVENAQGNLTGAEQYIRVTKVASETRQFTDDRGDFQKVVHTLSLSDALTSSFTGVNYPIRGNVTPATYIRETQVTDAAKYYGVTALDENAAQGDFSIKANTIFGQLVPSATVETPIVEAFATPSAENIIACGAAYSINVDIDSDTVRFGRPVLQGSVELGAYRDNGSGLIVDSSDNEKGFIDYATGIVTGLSGLSGNQVFTAIPAVALRDSMITDSDDIGFINIGYNYIKNLYPLPSKGTVFVDYLSQGKWYRLVDDGAGNLSDDFGGAGTVDYSTGSVLITTGALPDADTKIIWSWATHGGFTKDVAPTDEIKVAYEYVIGEIIEAGTVEIEWVSGGQTKTATDDGAGNITGDATGTVLYGMENLNYIKTGVIRVVFDGIVDFGTAIQIKCSKDSGRTRSFHAGSDYSITSGAASFSIGYPVKEKTFSASFLYNWHYKHVYPVSGFVDNNERGARRAVVEDIGAGVLKVTFIGHGRFVKYGSINYSTGDISIPIEYSDAWSEGVPPQTVWQTKEWAGSLSVGTPINTSFLLDEDDFSDSINKSETVDELVFFAKPVNNAPILPNSLEFTLAGHTYYDNNGNVFRLVNRQENEIELAGTINYEIAEIRLNNIPSGGSNSIVVKTMLTERGKTYYGKIIFRTAGNPLRPASFFIKGNAEDGTVKLGSSNNQGVISGDGFSGLVDNQVGYCAASFVHYLEARNIKYNAVVQSSLPLDAEILGISPIRLPIDGRVPIIRAGDVVVLFSNQVQELDTPQTSNKVNQLADTSLASVDLYDANGLKVDKELYAVDRELGTVTMADALDLTGYTEPLSAHYRYEDMALVNEVFINGQLSLVGSISRNYSKDDSFIASALIFKDLGSRYYNLFSQVSWTSVWSDNRIGSNTSAQYNERLYPIEVNNKNAIRERWAIIFTSSTNFNVLGETTGQIATGNTGTDCEPTNPITGQPYFKIPKEGWGTGWANGNVVRFNTEAAHAPIWLARTTINGAPTQEDDSFKLQIRGDNG